jgi:hypothetical protein
MSKNINVNPDHYKTRGREPQGQEVVHDLQRQKLTRERANIVGKAAPPPVIPGTTGKKPDRTEIPPEEDHEK